MSLTAMETSRTPRVRRRRAPTPTVLQMEAVECGAASLAMILAYHGRHLPPEQLRVMCGVSRDGSKASYLVRAARDLGLDATGRQVGTTALDTLTPPAILFWEFNHFVVWEGCGRLLGRKVVHLNDPALGRRALTTEEFSRGFTGVVLTFTPNARFAPGGRKPSFLPDLLRRLRGTYGAMALVLLAGLLLIVTGTMTPAFTRGFIDTVLAGTGSAPLGLFFTAMAVTLLLTMLLVGAQQTYLLRMEMLSSIVHSAQFMQHLLRLPIPFFTRRQPGDIAQRFSMNLNVARVFSRHLSTTLTNALVMVVFAMLMVQYNLLLATFGIAMAVLHVALTRFVMRIRANSAARLRVEHAKLISMSYSGLNTIEIMKATGSESDYFRRWGDQHAGLLDQQRKVTTPAAVLSSVGTLLVSLNVALILLVGGLQAAEGRVSIGLLIAFQTVLAGFSKPITELSTLIPVVQDAVADSARLKDVEVAEQDAQFSQRQGDDGRRLNGHVRFQSVTFGYARFAPPLLTDFTFEVSPGHQVALVGGSGSGKSTVGRLLAGLEEPWSGSIEFDGTPRAQVPRGTLTASVAFVDQEIYLFEATIRDNVTLWDPSISDDAVVAALRDACLDDIIEAQSKGIHGVVEEDGRNFSGGQRQRIEIARALVRDPSVLILDEATSALDAETEKRISDNLRRRGCSCVVIAHRLSTVRACDEILVLDAGRVMERGTHDTLVAAGGSYAELARRS